MSSAAKANRRAGIAVVADRWISINGPPVLGLPDWGLTRRTEACEFHLLPPITYEIHYVTLGWLMVHAFTAADARGMVGEGAMMRAHLPAGATCLIPPGMSVRRVQDEPAEFLAVNLLPDRFAFAADRVAGAGAWRPEIVHEIVDPGLVGLFREMRRTMISESFGMDAYLDTLAETAAARMAAVCLAEPAMRAERESLAPAVAKRLAARIEERLADGVGVADLAEEAGLSRAHFSRAFARSFGAPPAAYVASRRIARAQELLGDTDLSATEIALRCGFANPSHLTTGFRKALGLTPTAYRRALAKVSP